MIQSPKNKRRRIANLSTKPEPGTGRYYASYRDTEGKPRRKRFTKDRKESKILYHHWVVEKYDQYSNIIVRTSDFYNTNLEQSLPSIANAYIQHEKRRVRPDGAKRAKGTISIRVFDDNRRQVVNILRWCKDRFNEDLRRKSLQDLMTETDYESMMLYFVNHFSASQVNKHRHRFWNIIRFARREPFSVRFPFGPQDVRSFGGTENRKERQVPTVKMIQQLLSAASERERLWIWMGLGLGFGNDDLARACPMHFDHKSFDMRRGKTGLPRYGEMRPMVWAHLQRYLRDLHREEDELLFITRNGNPLVWVKTKTEDEMKNGTKSRAPATTPFKRCDSLAQSWSKLKNRAELKNWKEGFYILRHLGATAFASLPGVGIAQVRTFLGHGKSDAADQYMKPLTPETKRVVDWINRMLDSNDLNAWRKK